jgi:hypothetical protein
MHIWTSIDSPAVLSEFASRLNKLRETPYSKLRALPESVGDSVTIDDRDITFTTYRKIVENDDLEIVLHISIPLRDLVFTKVDRVFADGFLIAPDGETRPLSKEALSQHIENTA